MELVYFATYLLSPYSLGGLLALPPQCAQRCLAVNVWVETHTPGVSLGAQECRDKSERVFVGGWRVLGTGGLLSGRPEATGDL